MWRKNGNPNNNCSVGTLNWVFNCLIGPIYNSLINNYNLMDLMDGPYSCGIGIDLNRNWDFHWGTDDLTSNNSCSDMYHGPDPFSEAETVNIKNYLESLNQKPVLGLALHSYSQLWLWPYGYSEDERPKNYEEIVSLFHFV